MKRSVFAVSFLVFLSLMIFGGTWAWSAGPKGAKALFYSGEGTTVSNKSPAKQPSRVSSEPGPSAAARGQYMGVQYWIDRLSPSGELKRASSSATFRRGDRIKVSLRSNQDGYLYVINVGSTGASTVLFPTESAQGTNLVLANQVLEIPPNGFFRFDENPGEEILLVMLSPTPIDSGAPGGAPPTRTAEAEQAPAAAPAQGAETMPPPQQAPAEGVASRPPNSDPVEVAYNSKGIGSKGIARGSKDIFVENLKNTASTRAYGGKDMYLEEDRGASPSTFVVAPVSALQKGNQLISLKIKLKHR